MQQNQNELKKEMMK